MPDAPGMLSSWLIFFQNLFSFNLLGWHWLIKLYRFQVYNSVLHHPYIALRVQTLLSYKKDEILPFAATWMDL